MEVNQTGTGRNKNLSGMIVYQTDTGEIRLSSQVVRAYLVNGNAEVSDQEVTLFMALCKGQKLNPFIREAYLIKYSASQPATVVVSKDVFQKRADQHPQYDGKRAGVIVEEEENGVIAYREGEFYLRGSEKLLGGWCEVYRKDREQSERAEVLFDEYAGYGKDGRLNTSWQKRPATMIRKVAVAHALRDAFPREFQGLYLSEEMGVEPVESYELSKPDEILAETQSDKTKTESDVF